MGDRIAVMNLGVLQQIGTPVELYTNPANTFVATFIGSPAMNLLPSEALGIGIGGAGRLVGFRPEDVQLANGKARDCAECDATVEVVQYLGDEQLAYLKLRDAEIVAKLPLDADLPQRAPAEVRGAAPEAPPLRRRDAAPRSAWSPDPRRADADSSATSPVPPGSSVRATSAGRGEERGMAVGMLLAGEAVTRDTYVQVTEKMFGNYPMRSDQAPEGLILHTAGRRPRASTSTTCGSRRSTSSASTRPTSGPRCRRSSATSSLRGQRRSRSTTRSR